MQVYTLELMNSDITARFEALPHTPDYLYFNDPYHAFFYILNRYGFRHNELVNSARFARLDANRIQVPLSKGQGTRLITDSEESIDNLLTSLVYYDFFYYVNNSTASELFKRFLQKQLFLTTGKSLTTHFFRHKLVKNMYASGQTPKQIGAYIGEINLNNVNGYITSSILYQDYNF